MSATLVRTARALALLFAALALTAQDQGASISGIVYDNLGAPFSGAEVRLKNAPGTNQLRTTSAAKGEFLFAGLPAGTYEITVLVHGATIYSAKDLVVGAEKALKLEIHPRDTNLGAIGDNVFAAAVLDRRPSPTGPTPRALDGHPDLSGVWSPVEIVATTETELLPWAQAEMKRPDRMSPNAFCLPQGTRLGGATVFKIIQAPRTIVTLTEDIFTYRQIHMDGRGHPRDADPTWMGHSIGRWEGDTLVVDTANYNNKSWLPFGRPHTEQLHVIERFRRPDEGHLEYEFNVDDPGTFTRPWSIKQTSKLLPGEEIGEYICTENEQDIGHYDGKRPDR